MRGIDRKSFGNPSAKNHRTVNKSNPSIYLICLKMIQFVNLFYVKR